MMNITSIVLEMGFSWTCAQRLKGASEKVAARASNLEEAQMTAHLTRFAVASLLSLCASASAAVAGSVTQPGETIGAAAGAPPPPGFYLISTSDWGHRDGVDVNVAVNIPVLAWSTPWTILGGRVVLLTAVPSLHVDPRVGLTTTDIYN